MDVVEVSLPLDNADVTSLAALKVIYVVFGLGQASIDPVL
jgi:arginase family enzyme